MSKQLTQIKSQINLQQAQISLQRKRLKELIRNYVLIDYRHDLEAQHEKLPTPVASSMIDCINFLLGEK